MKMDQEFEDSTEEKLHNEYEHQEQEQEQEQEEHHHHRQQQLEEAAHQAVNQVAHQAENQAAHQPVNQVAHQAGNQAAHQAENKAGNRAGHLFGRQKPVHSALGGGKPADVILWRNKQMSAALLAGSTVIWLLFEWIGYHLIPFICHFLILSLATLFLWSNLSFYVHKSPLNFPEVELPEDLCMTVALLLRDRCNQAISVLWEVASGKDLKRFLTAIFALWVVSIVGSWFDFLTIVYIIFVMILTMPPLYEKHEDQVDSYALKAKAKLKRQYSKLDERVLQKLPKVPFISDNKQH